MPQTGQEGPRSTGPLDCSFERPVTGTGWAVPGTVRRRYAVILRRQPSISSANSSIAGSVGSIGASGL